MNWSDNMRSARAIVVVTLTTLFILNGVGVVSAQGIPAANQDGPNWVLIVLRVMSIAAIALAIIIDVNLVIGVIQWQRRRYERKALIEIENLGNVLSPFRLRAEHPSGELQFSLLFDEIELEYETIPTAAAEPEAQVQEEGPATSARSPSSAKAALKDTRKKAAQARGFSYFIANLLGTIASILPHSMAAPLRRIVGQLRQKQAAVSRIERAPRQMTQTAGQAGRMLRKKPSARAKAAQKTAQGPQPAALAIAEEIWSETPEVGPGESIALELTINPFKRPRQTRDYSITFLSQVIGEQEAPTVSAIYDLTIEQVSPIRHILPYILIAVLFTAEIALIWFLVTSTGLLGS
jgi:hypothetical protein